MILPEKTTANQKLNNYRAFNHSIGTYWHKIKTTEGVQDCIDWCFNNCQGRFSFESYFHYVVFYFKSKNDYSLFLLTWGGNMLNIESKQLYGTLS